MTDAQKRAKSAYRQKCSQLRVDLYLSDQDIVEHLKAKESVAAYIKQLIRDDIKRDEV